MRAGRRVDDRVRAFLLHLGVFPIGGLAPGVLEEDHLARPTPQRGARVRRFEGDLHPLPVALVHVVELVEVPEEPVLDRQAGMADLMGDVRVGDRGSLAFALEPGEVPGVDAGVVQWIAGDVEVVLVAETGDVGRGRRFGHQLFGFAGNRPPQLDGGIAEHRRHARRLVLLR